MGQFVNAVTVDVQTFWEEQFAASGSDYPETLTVLFTGRDADRLRRRVVGDRARSTARRTSRSTSTRASSTS